MRSTLGLVILLGFVSSAYASSIEVTNVSKIAIVQAYADFGGGDFIFTLESSALVCKGYWLPQDAPGSATLIAMVLAAHKAKSNVQVWGHTTEQSRWPGSTGTHYCKVYSLKDAG